MQRSADCRRQRPPCRLRTRQCRLQRLQSISCLRLRPRQQLRCWLRCWLRTRERLRSQRQVLAIGSRTSRSMSSSGSLQLCRLPGLPLTSKVVRRSLLCGVMCGRLLSKL